MEEFAFEAVIVNAQGEIITRRPGCAQQLVEDLGKGVTLELVAVPGGSFTMGSPPHQGYEDERPQHMVRVAPFLLGRYPVTQEQWQAVMGKLPPIKFGADEGEDFVGFRVALIS